MEVFQGLCTIWEVMKVLFSIRLQQIVIVLVRCIL